MSLQIKSLTLGPFATNAYLVADTKTNNAILIDPVDDAPVILDAANEEGWAIKLMLATHAHLDHVLASAAIQEQLRIPFLIHAECAALLDEIPLQGMYFGLGQLPEPAKPDRLLKRQRIDRTRLNTPDKRIHAGARAGAP